MNIAILNNRYGRNAVGGAERMVAKQREVLRKDGNTVVVLASESYHGVVSFAIHKDPDDPEGVLRFLPINIVSFERLARLSIGARMLWHVMNTANVHSMFELARWFRRFRPEEIITHNLMGIGFLTRWAIRWAAPRARWVHVLHDIQLLYPSGILLWGEEQSWKYRGGTARWYRALTRWLMGSPGEIVSPSAWLLNEHQKEGFFPHSKYTVRSPVPLRHGVGTESSAVFRKRDDTAVLKLLFVGQIEQHKGIEFLLQVFRNYSLQTTHYKLDVVGDGLLRERLQEEYPDHRWYGRLDGDRLKEIWQNTDALIVPSLCYENAPTVIAEALEYRIPGVASCIGGIPEVVREG